MSDLASAACRRGLLKGAGGLACSLAIGRAPAFAQTAPKKLVFAHIGAPPESAAVAFARFAQEVTDRSRGGLAIDFQGATRFDKEVEVVNAVRAGDVAIGNPAFTAATVFPEMVVFLVPYRISSYDQAYRLLNGDAGRKLDRTFQEKYGVKVLCFFDYGFRHFWNTRRPINEPGDLRGLKLRVPLPKVCVDAVNGLGGDAVPMACAEIIAAAEQGVVDGADLPVASMARLKAPEAPNYCSLTYHSFTPSANVMNLQVWNGLTPEQQALVIDASMQAQAMIREATESADTLAGAKAELEPRGVTVNPADTAAFRTIAQQRIWPAYQKQNPELWDLIAATPD